MSYDVVFKRQFIKTTRGIVPTVLIGANNLTLPTGNGHSRIVREWAPVAVGSEELPAEELMKRVEAILPERNQEHFKFNGSWVDNAGLLRFFKNGIKDALSIEEMKALSSFPEEVVLFCQVFVVKKDRGGTRHELRERINTTQELEWWMDRANGLIPTLADDEQYARLVSFMSEDPIPYPTHSLRRRVRS